jgi:hypothetical protein
MFAYNHKRTRVVSDNSDRYYKTIAAQLVVSWSLKSD